MTKKSKVQCKNSSSMELCKERKSWKVSLEALPTEEIFNTLKARVAELRRETTTLNQQLRSHATLCEQLSEDNKLLMDELRKICKPWVIEVLEAKNPETNTHTD